MKITTTQPLYALMSLATGQVYPISAEETQRLLDQYKAISATPELRMVGRTFTPLRTNEQGIRLQSQ